MSMKMEALEARLKAKIHHVETLLAQVQVLQKEKSAYIGFKSQSEHLKGLLENIVEASTDEERKDKIEDAKTYLEKKKLRASQVFFTGERFKAQ